MEEHKKLSKHFQKELGIDDNSDSDDDEKLQIDSFLGITDIKKLLYLFNPASMYKHEYVLLDTDYRRKTETSANVSRFSWNYSLSRNVSTEFCTSAGPISNIVGMRLYQPTIHYLAAMVTSSRRITVLIEELSSQSYVNSNGEKYHFILRPNYPASGTPSYIELSTEDYNDGLFSFKKPITSLNTITVVFGTIGSTLEFPVSSLNRFIIPIEFTCLKPDK